jgi:hypothetical protein
MDQEINAAVTYSLLMQSGDFAAADAFWSSQMPEIIKCWNEQKRIFSSSPISVADATEQDRALAAWEVRAAAKSQHMPCLPRVSWRPEFPVAALSGRLMERRDCVRLAE